MDADAPALGTTDAERAGAAGTGSTSGAADELVDTEAEAGAEATATSTALVRDQRRS